MLKQFIALVILFNSSVFAAKLNIVTEHLAPFQIVSPSGISGLSTEIIEKTLKESGYDYDIEAHPWSLAYHRGQQEKNTCIYSLARLPDREPLFQWVGHLITSTSSFYKLKSNNLVLSSLDDAKKYKTAVIKDDVTHHFLLSKGFVENENLYVMNNYNALLKLLELPSRQIDLVIINDDLINNRVKNKVEAAKYQNVYLLDELSLNFNFACSLSTNHEMIDNLRHIMKQLEQQGVYSEIRNKWRKQMVNVK